MADIQKVVEDATTKAKEAVSLIADEVMAIKKAKKHKAWDWVVAQGFIRVLLRVNMVSYKHHLQTFIPLEITSIPT